MTSTGGGGSPQTYSFPSSMTQTPRPGSPGSGSQSGQPRDRVSSSSTAHFAGFTSENLFLHSQIQSLLADFASFRATSADQHELLIGEAAHWKRIAEDLQIRADEADEWRAEAQQLADWRARVNMAEVEFQRLRGALERAEAERDQLHAELEQERERSIRLLASVAHLDRTIARLRESNERFERENKVLLQTITHTDAARNISFLQTPSLTSRPASRTGAASVSSSSSSRDPPDRRSLPSRTTEMDYSQLPPIPTSSIHAPQFPRRTSPSETFSHPVIGSTLPSPITPSSTTTIVSDPPPPLSRKHSQRIKESKSSIFGSAEEPEAGEPAPPAKPEPQPTDELSKDEIMAKMDYFSAQKNLLESQLQKPANRARKEELSTQLERAEKELGWWKMRLRLFPKVPAR